MRIVIIGGVGGGAACAAKLRRLSEDTEIIMIEKNSDVSFASCGFPYYLGGVIRDRETLVISTPDTFKKLYNIDVRIRSEVLKIDAERRSIFVRNLDRKLSYNLTYDKLVLSPGARPVIPPIENIEEEQSVFTLRNMDDLDKIHAAMQKSKNRTAVVIGGGYIGLETADMLSNAGFSVTLLESSKQIMPALDIEMTAPIISELNARNITLRTSSFVNKVSSTDHGVLIRTGDRVEIEVGMVILCVGVQPDTQLAETANLTMGQTGGIWVDEHMRTSNKDIYAIGDVVEVNHIVSGEPVLVPLSGPTTKQANIAADNIMGIPKIYSGAQGTAICKIGTLTAAVTGLTERALKAKKLTDKDYFVVYSHSFNHAPYYPNAKRMSIKVIFSRATGKILGAQIVGKEDVDKKIDMFAAAIRCGLDITALTEMELAYAPPYGSNKDIVNVIGFMAENIHSGYEIPAYYQNLSEENLYILDVRTYNEFISGHIEGAVNIPALELRERIKEIPSDKNIIVYCGVGQRSHVACRMLTNSGIPCRNFSGGYITYSMFKATAQ